VDGTDKEATIVAVARRLLTGNRVTKAELLEVAQLVLDNEALGRTHGQLFQRYTQLQTDFSALDAAHGVLLRHRDEVMQENTRLQLQVEDLTTRNERLSEQLAHDDTRQIEIQDHEAPSGVTLIPRTK
jgi:chromosome segregation ATPase